MPELLRPDPSGPKPRRVAARQRAGTAAWHRDNPDAIRQLRADHKERERQRDLATPKRAIYRHVWKRWRLTPEDYEWLIANGCAICGGRERLCVDHDHVTGEIRGCLCHSCNIGLGFVERPGGWLERALAYVRSPHDPKRGG